MPSRATGLVGCAFSDSLTATFALPGTRGHQREVTRGIRGGLRPSRGFGVGWNVSEGTPDGSPNL